MKTEHNVTPCNNPTTLKAARAIAAKGKRVFPCKADKKPNTPNGFKDASVDPAKVTAMFKKRGSELIGVPTGPDTGLLVIDFDIYKRGAMTVEEFEEKYGEISHSKTVKTGSGGLQVYLNYPSGEDIRNSAGA